MASTRCQIHSRRLGSGWGMHRSRGWTYCRLCLQRMRRIEMLSLRVRMKGRPWPWPTAQSVPPTGPRPSRTSHRSPVSGTPSSNPSSPSTPSSITSSRSNTQRVQEEHRQNMANALLSGCAGPVPLPNADTQAGPQVRTCMTLAIRSASTPTSIAPTTAAAMRDNSHRAESICIVFMLSLTPP